VEGRVDLARLAAMLPATLRIRPQTQVTSGQLQVSLQSGPGPQGVEWHGRVEASGLAAINAGRELSWPQPLLVTISAHDSPQGPVVDSLTCQSEFLQVQAAGTPEQCTASAKFDIDRLAGQLSGLIDLGGWRLSGSGGLTAGWSRSPQQQFSARAELQVTGFELAVPGRPAWKEDRLAAVLAAQGQTDFTPQTRVDAGGLTVESGADRLEIALRAPVAGLGDGGVWPVEVRSTGQLAQWLARLSPWISLDGWQIGGSYDLAVQATASQSEVRVDQGRVTLAELRVEGHGLAVYEPRTELTVSAGGWERANRGVDVAAAALAGTSLSARADKSAVRLPEAGPAEVQLAGQVDYDLEKITPWLNGLVGAEVQLAGRGSSPIAVRGPLTPEGLEAHTQAGWAYAGLYGFEIGPGTLKADLAKGLLSIPPTQVEASGGRILLGGQLRLAPEPQELVVPPGRVVDQVEVNPRMCYYALKYIAPVVAGVASADGRFSIELDQCRIPLADPAKGELSGRMIVHSVRVGPGPLARELAVLLGYQSPAELTRESVIDFRMADGRVYHRGLETHFGQVTMTTSGSVGLDQSLSLVAEMPIPPTWLANRPLLNSALRNQTIRIPIGGTLEKPVLDAQAIQELSRQFLQNATRNLLEDQLNRFFPQQ